MSQNSFFTGLLTNGKYYWRMFGTHMGSYLKVGYFGEVHQVPTTWVLSIPEIVYEFDF